MAFITDKELELMMGLAAKVPAGGLIIEVGALYGWTTAAMAKAAPHAHLIAVDNFSWAPIGPTSPELLLGKVAPMRNVTVMKGDSVEIGRFFHGPADLALVDGCHSSPVVDRDLENFSRVAPLMAAHDYGNPHHPDVKKAVDAFVVNHPGWCMTRLVDTMAVLERKSAL